MIIMALDHTRDYFTYLTFQPEDLTRSFPALFFTRWITHFCASAFFFLAGTGAFLSTLKKNSVSSLSHFLWTRGLWLIFLELTVIDFGFTFSGRYQLGVVIWTLGWSMIVLALLIHLRPSLVAGFACGLIVFHNAFDRIRPSGVSPSAFFISFLHVPNFQVLKSGRVVGILYPLIPWVGVMAAGYLFGYVYKMDARKRRAILLFSGSLTTLVFIGLRASNWYGDPRPWSHQRSLVLTVCSFLNCTKYPPSLCFLLMTLGPCLLFLAWAEGKSLAFGRLVLTYGRVPLFFFVLHIYVIHILAVAVAWMSHQPLDWLFHGAVMTARPAGYGYSLPVVYLIWTAVVVGLYPVCRWYAEIKRCSSNPLFSYL